MLQERPAEGRQANNPGAPEAVRLGPSEMRLSGGSAPTRVTFYFDDGQEVEALRRLDPDIDLSAFRLGERSWVVQTYLRLLRAGYPVELSAEPPQQGLVVFHAKQKRSLARVALGDEDLIFVGIRADNSAPLLADFEIVQNGRFADGHRRFAVPFWPQPGLIPRDVTRGTALERVGYVGLIENLHPDFRDDRWPRALRELGLEWAPKAVRFQQVNDPNRVDWEDYRTLDALIAVRPVDPRLSYCKPANKLINAWRAGVPALMGPEFAFREIRQCESDYLEVADGPAALAALRQLRSDPALFRRLVSHGRTRALEYSFEAITEAWGRLLFETIPACVASNRRAWSRRLPIPLRLPLRRLTRWIGGAHRR